MLPVKEFTNGPAGFPSLINYFEFVDEGILFNRDGSLLGCFYYRGPDMSSSMGLGRRPIIFPDPVYFSEFRQWLVRACGFNSGALYQLSSYAIILIIQLPY